MKLEDAAPWKKSYEKPREWTEKQRHHFADKGLSSQSYGFSSSNVWLCELDHKEGWVPKNWCFWTVVLEKTLESPLDGKEIKSVSPKGCQPWMFIGRTDAEAPILWPPDAKNQLIGKDSDARQEEKRVTEDERAGWHHQLYGHRVWANSGRYWRLTCFSPWGCKELDTTEWLNSNNKFSCRVSNNWTQATKETGLFHLFSTCGVDLRIACRMRPSLCRVLFWLLNPHLIKKLFTEDSNLWEQRTLPQLLETKVCVCFNTL